MRPANIVTAFADILAGFAVAGGVVSFTGEAAFISHVGLWWLLLSTFGLYGGGVVFNDVFDAELDSKERPERAIPSGRVSILQASLLGTLLHILGVITAFQVNQTAGFIAITVAILTIIYDSKAKNSVIFGPIFMGLCRGGNLLLGISIVPGILFQSWFLAFIPIVYIASITLISR
ncbi:MAG: UbiA-like protein EboC, partial [Bacteroidetes bacterium]|nr:UbiA-like protein EboC [Bacteroidota bacterium]